MTTAAAVTCLLAFALDATADPAVHTGPATGLSGDSAMLNGDTVTPVGGGSVTFEYGETSSYGSSTAAASVAGGGDASVSAAISGLTNGTVYHYRLDVTIGATTTFGADRTFTANGTASNAAPTCDAVSLSATTGTASTAAPSCSDADGDLLSFAISGAPSHGTASVIGGQLSYTSTSGYIGADSFTYTASDGAASSAPATVTVTVAAAAAVAPTIATLLPATGVVGSSITVSGAGFTGTTAVTIGGVPASFTVVSPTSITVSVPAGAASGFVAVTNPAGTATSLGPFLVLPSGSFAHVFTVNSTADGVDTNAGDGSCDDGTAHCTLRAAIQEANAATGHDLIAFAIANSGVQTISPASTLPAITDPVTVDGTTEPGFTNGLPLVVVTGDSAGTTDGLTVTAGSSTVRGLVITRFAGWQIHLSGSGGDVVAGNFIGSAPDGSGIGTPAGRPSSGLFVENVPNTIVGGTGGTSSGACTGDCNLFATGYPASGAGIAVRIQGSGATGTVVAGNFIGTTRTGGAIPGGIGGSLGVSISNASGTTIGGTTAAARNLISSQAFYGVRLDHAPSTAIQGNWFGLDATGTTALPTTAGNIYDDGFSPGTTIGGLTATPGTAPGNVISGSATVGVQAGSSGVVVQGNLVGTDASGTTAVGNGDGIDVLGPITIGGSDPRARNVVSGNKYLGVFVNVGGATIRGNDIGTTINGAGALGNSTGIQIGSQFSGPVSGVTISGNVVSGQALQSGTYLTSADGIVVNGGGTNDSIVSNLIGVAADGSSPLGNAGNGVNAISVGLGTVVGGSASSAWNTIANNGRAGVKAGTAGVVVLGNSIHDNSGLGIDNALSSANGKLTIAHVVPSASSSTVTGSLSNLFAGSPYLVQLYLSSACDASGSGEGTTFVGSFTLTPAAAGTATFTQTVPVSIGPGQSLSGTVTIGNTFQGNIDTGQFSSCKVTGNANLALAETASPAPVDQGSKLTLTYTVTNNGPDPAPGPSLAATFPSNATFASAKTTAGTCSGVKGSASCVLDTLTSGQTATVTVVLFPVVAGTFASGGSVTSAVDDPAPGNETTSVPITVRPAAFTPASYVVNSTGDSGDADVGDLLCDDGTGHCTLRAAIEQANLAPGANTISFAIPGSGIQTIAPASSLPTISDPVTIDARTQPGYAGQPLVEINGSSTGDGTEGLTINAGASTVRGLVIDGFRSWAIHLLANGNDTIAGNYIGTTPDGMTVGGSVQHPSAGIFVDGVGGNTIGGTTGTTPGSACAGDCNLISPGYMSGSFEGVKIAGSGATGNVVEGNFIGTTRLGQTLVGGISGAVTGVQVSGADRTTIGGSTAGARNLIANIAFYGVRLDHATNTTVAGDWFGIDASGAVSLPITQGAVYDDGSSPGTVIGGLTSVPGTAPGNVMGGTFNNELQVQTAGTLVQGNLIGTDATGTQSLGHSDGIDVLGAVTIGGSDPRARNVISGNELGLYVVVGGSTIQGNYIGTDITGNAPLGNSIGVQIGSQFAAGTSIARTTITGNVISGQSLRTGTTFTSADGIVTDAGSDQTTITGNLIGVAANGLQPLPNTGDGIHAVRGGLVFIGGSTRADANTIAGNGHAGIHAELAPIVVYGNSIHDNTGLGISAPTSLANGKLTIGSIVPSGGGSTVNATITGALNGTAKVQLYENVACDPSGVGEGQTFLGIFPVTLDASGNATLAAPVSAIPAGAAVTGTLTLGNTTQGDITTSEFTSCAITGSADLGVTGTASPSPVDPGHKLTLTFHVTNHGPDTASAPGLSLTFPPNATFVSATATAGSCTGVRGAATCAFGALADGATATVTVVLYPIVPGATSASATVTTTQADGSSANNAATVPFTVTNAVFTPASFVVNSTGDGGDSDPADLSCNDGTGACTLRAAIEQANSAPGANTISFAIPGSGVQTIAPATALPTITDPVVLDATTQPGYAGTPLVEISGASLPDKTDGLVINAGSSTVLGLVVDHVRGWSIHLLGNGGNRIAANFIGATPDGMDVGGTPGQQSDGIFVDGVGGNTIGGTTGTTQGACTGDCNLISPGYMASGSGVAIEISGAGATNNVVQGNFVGTTRLGQALPHSYSGATDGVLLSNASNTTIGGTTAAARNLFANIAFYGVRLDHATNTTVAGDWFGIDGSGGVALPITAGAIYDDGSSPGTVIGGLASTPGTAPGNVIGAVLNSNMQVSTTGTLVEGNLIGTDATGTQALGQSDGIDVLGAVTVGGSDPRARNVISGNRDIGVFVNVGGATIQGNYIGTNVDGTAALPNSVGIVIGSQSSGSLSGTIVTGNVISGQALQPGTYLTAADGVLLTGSGTDRTTITGNRIGVVADGLTPLPNAGDGVHATNGGLFFVGGQNSGDGNTIAFNGGAGVHGEHGGDLVRGNSIHDNGGLGIRDDVAGLQTVTVDSVGAVAGGTEITGSATGVTNAVYRIELFKSASCDPSGAGEGAVFLGAVDGSQGNSASVSFDTTVTRPVYAGESVTATVSIGNSIQGLFGTSPFSVCFTSTSGGTAPPTITAPSDLTVGTGPGATCACAFISDVMLGTATVSTGATATRSGVPNGNFFPVGTTTITWTATNAGGTASATQHVTVNDTTPPTITAPPDVTTSADPGLTTATVDPGTPIVSDNVPGTTYAGARSDGRPLSAPYPTGTTTITWTVTDAAGNTATATQHVTVADTEPPTITAPADVTAPTDPGLATANVATGSPTVADNTGTASVTSSRSDGQPLSAPYPLGATTITWTATDGSGNAASATQHVTVVDREPPTIHAQGDITVPADPGLATALVTVGAPTVSDNSGSFTVTSSRNDGQPLSAPYRTGTTTITWTATDAAGNSATATQHVTVNDTEPPTITAPADVTVPTDPGLATANVATGSPTVADNTGTASVTSSRSDGRPLTDPFPLGATTITWKATDGSGNAASATQHVTVVDHESPVVTPPANVTTTAHAGDTTIVVTYGSASTTDNAPGVGAATCAPASGSSFPLGTTTVVCSATDASGNVGHASFTVFVNTPPVVDSAAIDQPTPRTGATLTTTVHAHDANGDTLAYAYRWFRNGVAIAGETGPTLDLSKPGNGDRGDAIALEVTANDGQADSFPLRSFVVTVADTPPVLDSVVVKPTAPDTNSTVSAVAQSHDADGDTVTYTYTWSKNGTPIPGATGATLDLSVAGNGDGGDQITVTATPTDGSLAGTSLTSAAVTVTGSGPPVLHLSATSATVQYSDPLAPIAVTATGDHITFGATGLPAGVTLTPTVAGATIAGTVTAPAGTYSAQVTASDGTTTVTSPLTITVTKEGATVAYTGELLFPSLSLTTSVSLAATVQQAADGSLGDLTKAQVEFRLFRSGNTSSTPDLVVGPVAVSAAGAATATATLALDTWTVVTRVVPANTFFTSPSSDAATISVFRPVAFAVVVGAGFVRDPGGDDHANFSFETHSQRTGSADGGFRYTFRGSDGLNYSLRASSTEFLAISGPGGHTASFSGQATVVARDPRTDNVVPSAGGGTFFYRVDATDSGGAHTRDQFALVVTRPDGTVFHRVGTPGAPITIAAGNILVNTH